VAKKIKIAGFPPNFPRSAQLLARYLRIFSSAGKKLGGQGKRVQPRPPKSLLTALAIVLKLTAQSRERSRNMAIEIMRRKLFCPKCGMPIEAIMKTNSFYESWICKNLKCPNYKKELRKAIRK